MKRYTGPAQVFINGLLFATKENVILEMEKARVAAEQDALAVAERGPRNRHERRARAARKRRNGC